MADYDPPQKRGGRKPGQTNKHSIATMSRAAMDGFEASVQFTAGGWFKYFNKLAKTMPAKHADIAHEFIRMAAKNGSSEVGGVVINVVQLSSPAVPTPGVLCSPIPEHIAPQRHLTLVHDLGDADIIEAAGND
jgi:hypothetical protein